MEAGRKRAICILDAMTGGVQRGRALAVTASRSFFFLFSIAGGRWRPHQSGGSEMTGGDRETW